MSNSPNFKKLQNEDDGVISLLSLRISRLERENRGLRATVSRLRKTDLASENERLRGKVRELETLHWLDQSVIVRYRRIIGEMEGE